MHDIVCLLNSCTHLVTVLFGYPPKELPDYNPLLTLQSLGIKSGDTVTIEQLKSDRHRTIELRDVKRIEPNTSGIPSSSISTNASQNSNIKSNSRENDSEVMILNSTDAKNAVVSGTIKRGLDQTAAGGAEPSSSGKRSGKLGRK